MKRLWFMPWNDGTHTALRYYTKHIQNTHDVHIYKVYEAVVQSESKYFLFPSESSSELSRIGQYFSFWWKRLAHQCIHNSCGTYYKGGQPLASNWEKFCFVVQYHSSNVKTSFWSPTSIMKCCSTIIVNYRDLQWWILRFQIQIFDNDGLRKLVTCRHTEILIEIVLDPSLMSYIIWE